LAGAAYAYTRSGNTWGVEQKLVASDGAAGGGFGYAVAVSADGSRAVIGALGQSNGVGGVYLFGRTGSTWAQQERIGLTDGISGDLYGGAVATSADVSTTLIGAIGKNGASGAAYAFPAGAVVAALPGTTPQSMAVTAPFATPLAVHVTDTLTAVPLVDVAVRFVASPVGASGTFSGSATADVITDGNGDATAPAFTANATNGSYVVSVAVGGVTTPVFNLTNLPTSATRMAIVTGNGQSAIIGTAVVDPLSVIILDASGNGINGVPVTFTAPASGAGGAFVGGGATANVTTNSNGFANAPLLTANTVAGAYTVTAIATGIATPARFSLVNLPGAATHFALAFPPNVQAGKSAPLTLTALDVGGNAATGYSGTIHFTSTDPAASLPANYIFLPGDTGAHGFGVTFSAVGSKTVTATDTSSVITGNQSVNVTPSIMAVTPVNGPQTGGGPLTLVGVGLTGATGVTVGGVACTNIAVNGPGTDLICRLPTNQPAGTVDVTVTTPNGAATLAHGYTFLPASLAPMPSGRASGGRGVGSAPAPAPASR
jgi:hypothetical protein